jgi:hypothetical protein
MDKFWMVLADNSSMTNVRHAAFDLAQREAERLANNNPGVKFFVLGAEGFATKRKPVDWVPIGRRGHYPGCACPECCPDPDEIPF